MVKISKKYYLLLNHYLSITFCCFLPATHNTTPPPRQKKKHTHTNMFFYQRQGGSFFKKPPPHTQHEESFSTQPNPINPTPRVSWACKGDPWNNTKNRTWLKGMGNPNAPCLEDHPRTRKWLIIMMAIIKRG